MTQATSSLKFPPRSKQEQLQFLQCIWPELNDRDFNSANYERFFISVKRYFNRKYENYPEGYLDGTKDNIGEYIQRLRERPDLTKPDHIAAVESDIPDDVLGRTFEIAASILLGVGIDSDNSRYHGIRWDSAETLREVLQAKFSLTNTVPDNIDGMDNNMIPSRLTLQHLCSRYGYSISWTSDLSEHLVVDKAYREIKVYEHLVFLRDHRKYSSSPLPASIVEEAIDTLVVLFPPNQMKTKWFLKSHGRDFSKLGFCNLEKRRNLSEYRYFRNRMSELKEILNYPPMAFHRRLWENVWMTAAIASQCHCCDIPDGVRAR